MGVTVDAIVQVQETCQVPGYIGILGYVKEIAGPTVHVEVFTVPRRLSNDVEKMIISVSIQDLVSFGIPELLPN